MFKSITKGFIALASIIVLSACGQNGTAEDSETKAEPKTFIARADRFKVFG